MSQIVAASVTPAQSVDAPPGSPRRPWTAWLAAATLYCASAATVVGLLVGLWQSVNHWPDAALLHRLLGGLPLADLDQGQAAALRAGAAATEFLVAVAVGAVALIAGYYGWMGYRWARWAGVIATALVGLTALLNSVAWAAIPLVAVGALALWLPPSVRYYDEWRRVRHPAAPYPEIVDRVSYGPLARYLA